MELIYAILLGLLQGLTEFLPVSSSGHIELGKAVLQLQHEDDLLFTLLLHAATVLSILLVFRKDIFQLITDLIKGQKEAWRFAGMIVLSMIPIGLMGVFFEEQVTHFFSGRLVLVGGMLILTGFILWSTKFEPKEAKGLNFGKAFLIGLAQAVAVLPGISRSGTTISVALLLGVSREQAARFSFLMVLAPILGATLLKLPDLQSGAQLNWSIPALIAGFIAAFLSGWVACQWMLAIVRKGNINYFAIYCWIIGAITLGFALWKG